MLGLDNCDLGRTLFGSQPRGRAETGEGDEVAHQVRLVEVAALGCDLGTGSLADETAGTLKADYASCGLRGQSDRDPLPQADLGRARP